MNQTQSATVTSSAASMAEGLCAPARAQSPKALVLLLGSVRRQGLGASANRSLVDLPLDADRTVLDWWREQAVDFARAAGIERLVIQVLADKHAPELKPPRQHERAAITIVHDAAALRGTGGALSDLALRYADDEWILVASGAQVLLQPLMHLVPALADTGGDVALVSHDDGVPSGLMLVRCGSLRVVPRIGFSDMKEQALPLIARTHPVKVLHRREPVGLPIRSTADYITAVRQYHRAVVFSETRRDPFAEDWQPTFSLVEPGAMVHPTSRVHDSVVLTGAKVGAGAVLVRSVVCPGAVVGRDQRKLDELVVGS